MSKAKLSRTMLEVLAFVKKHGAIERFPGGFWSAAPWGSCGWFGTTSVEALVARDVLEYCEWKDSRGGRFPIKAKLKEGGER